MICSLIWLRRSTASSAFDSAIDWFWQTRQRSCADRSTSRFCATGSSIVGSVDASAISGMQPTSMARDRVFSCLPQFLEQRQHLLLPDLFGDRADLLEADHAVLVDDECLRHAIDAIVDADAAIDVPDRQIVRITPLREPRPWRRRACPCSSGRRSALPSSGRARTSSGCSWRQATHHEAHTFSNHTCPFMSVGENFASGCASWASENIGAGLSMNGDGTSRGFSHSPRSRKTAKTRKAASGSR